MARMVTSPADPGAKAPAEDANSKTLPAKPKAGGKRALGLDPDIVAVMRLSTNLQRLSSRSLKGHWRERGLSERGLFMLELVYAGLDRPSRLMEYFDVLPSTITFETEKLVTAGLMVREPDPSDRRVVRLSLTEEGEAIHRETMAAINASLKPRLERLTPEELRAFLATFQKILGPDYL